MIIEYKYKMSKYFKLTLFLLYVGTRLLYLCLPNKTDIMRD